MEYDPTIAASSWVMCRRRTGKMRASVFLIADMLVTSTARPEKFLPIASAGGSGGESGTDAGGVRCQRARKVGPVNVTHIQM